MELSKGELRRLRIKTARPIYKIDQSLIKDAIDADGPEGKNDHIYSLLVANPSSQYIYRYLSEFAVSVLEKQTGKDIKDLRILDWGGGKGYISYFLSKKGAKVTLYETDNFKHTKLWQKYNLDVKTSDGEKLPIKSGSFDAVLCFGVLEHVPYDQIALLEVNRVLKDTGLFFCFNLPNQRSYIHKIAWRRGIHYHDRLYSRKETTMLLKRAGFNPVGKIWYRQLLPKSNYRYPAPKLFEKLDLFLTNYTPLCFIATNLEFVARKQYAYTSDH